MFAVSRSSAPPHIPTLSDRLANARTRGFAGREYEQLLWAEALAADVPRFSLLWLVGPPGVGKTSLLGRFCDMARAVGRLVVKLDARHLQGTRGEFLDVFAARASQAGASPISFDRISSSADPRFSTVPKPFLCALQGFSGVLLLDSTEYLGALETWLRDTFLPAMPTSWLVVLAGQTAPGMGFRDDPGWRDLMQVHSLRNLSSEDSTRFLATQGVLKRYHQALFTATFGHPLALSLAAAVMQQEGSVEPNLALHDPDLVATLLRRFSHSVPDARHRMALRVAAHVRIANESTLRHVMGGDDASELYDWLSSLSFSVVGVEGLYLHELAAHVLDLELRRRDPTTYLELHHKLRNLFLDQMRKSCGALQFQAAADLYWMHRHSPTLGALTDWSYARVLDSTPLQDNDCASIVAQSRRLQGEDMATAITFWATRQPQAFNMIRDRAGNTRGFVCGLILTLEDLESPEVRDADPRISPLAAYMETQAPLRKGERLGLFFWLDHLDHHSVGDLLAPIANTFMRHCLCPPGIAWNFVLVDRTAPKEWDAVLRHVEHFPGPCIAVGSSEYLSYGHDWRAMPTETFIEIMVEREVLGGQDQASTLAPTSTSLVLSREAFADAVRSALRAYTDTDALQDNPLLRCRVAKEATLEGEGHPLQLLLTLAVSQLGRFEKDEHLHSSIKLTYCDPGKTQQQTAELLGIPFSTYRRHLGTAVDRITDWLWERELNGYGPQHPRGL